MWIALALLTAACTALRDVASKRAVRTADPVAVALGVAGVPAITLGIVALATGSGRPGGEFWLALLVSGAVNAVATPLVVLALRRSDLSLVAPVTSLTPLFMIGTGAVVLGEVPGGTGMVGVTVIVVGAYLLSISDRSAGALAPITALVRDPGARLMLLVAFLYSISATYDKVGTRASDPLAWAASIHAVTALALVPVLAWRGRRNGAGSLLGRNRPRSSDLAPRPAGLQMLRGPVPAILLAGAFTAIGAAAQMTALMLTLAAYVIAVKRTSTLFSVVLGGSIFREERVGERLLGAVVMLVGFVLVTVG